jgi:hypothetical protein
MPTPESEAFLAKKPQVPASFDGVDFEDTARLKQAQDAIIREQWVQVMMGRLVREELSKCYYREGVNHLEKCGKLRGQFIFGREAQRHRGGGLGAGKTGCQKPLRPCGAWFGRSGLLTWAQSGTSSCSRTPRSRATSLSSRTSTRRRVGSNEGPRPLGCMEWALKAGHKTMMVAATSPGHRNQPKEQGRYWAGVGSRHWDSAVHTSN